MNILFTSAGRRGYLMRYFRDILDNQDQIHVANSENHVSSFIFCDKNIITPAIMDSNYIQFLLDYCESNKINAIIPLIDLDLRVLSRNRILFKKINVELVLSDQNVIEICNDKWMTYEFLIKSRINTPKTYKELTLVNKALINQEINYPIVLKPRFGMGSIGQFIAINNNELSLYYEKVKDIIIESYIKFNNEAGIENDVIFQEYIAGPEYHLDVINDLNQTYKTTIAKLKYLMKAGATDSAVTVDDDQLKKLGELLAVNLKHVANLDVDLIFNNNKYYVIDLNARFGGGYPFSHAAGVNLPLAIIKWLNNETYNPDILQEDFNVHSIKDIDIIRFYNS